MATPQAESDAEAPTQTPFRLMILSAETSQQGCRPTQEDRHISIVDFETPEDADERKATKRKRGSALGIRLGVPGGSESEECGWHGGYVSGSGDIALFGVFDGHNGDSAAEYCKENMPKAIAARVRQGHIDTEALCEAFVEVDGAFINRCNQSEVESLIAKVKAADESSDDNTSDLDDDDSSGDNRSSCAEPMTEETMDSIGAGCTAVVAMINNMTQKLSVAHCGDARCMVSTAGVGRRLTAIDHKPVEDSERKRVEAAGHFVINKRLDGQLMVSRAIGDRLFKLHDAGIQQPTMTNALKERASLTTPKYEVDVDKASRMALSACPDVVHLQLDVRAPPDVDPFAMPSPTPTDTDSLAGDQFVVLACDGLWDVMNEQDVVDWVFDRVESLHKLQSRRRRGRGRGGGDIGDKSTLTGTQILELMERVRTEDPTFNLADELAAAAINQGSTDNVTVLIVFLARVATDLRLSQSEHADSSAPGGMDDGGFDHVGAAIARAVAATTSEDTGDTVSPLPPSGTGLGVPSIPARPRATTVERVAVTQVADILCGAFAGAKGDANPKPTSQ